MNNHLALVTHYFSTHRGGVERVADELVRRLAECHGWTVTWLASDADSPPQDLPAAIRTIPMSAWNGIETRLGIPWPVWSPSALQKLWRVIGKADAVHLHDALYFGNALAWLFARLQRVPILVTQHVGTIPFRSPLIRVVHALANRTLGRIVLSGSHQVVFISPAVRDEYTEYCRFRRAPKYLANGVDTAVYRPEGPVADDPAIATTRKQNRRIFLFVGRFVEKKGLPILRELAATFTDDLWLFAGHGDQEPDSWGLPNVLVVRGKSGTHLAPYYRAADLLVLPSVGEGFPLVVQEAMACGTPAMVGDETAAGCPNARALLVVENITTGQTATRWAQRIRELYERPKQLQELRAKVAKFAHETWSWEATASAYNELITTICAKIRK